MNIRWHEHRRARWNEGGRQITKKTAKRIYFKDRYYHSSSSGIRVIDRQKIEQVGEVYIRHIGRIHLNKPLPVPDGFDRAERKLAEKAEMVAAHPDRGGSNEAFIKAHRRYSRVRGASR
jgi:hypothetical protein